MIVYNLRQGRRCRSPGATLGRGRKRVARSQRSLMSIIRERNLEEPADLDEAAGQRGRGAASMPSTIFGTRMGAVSDCGLICEQRSVDGLARRRPAEHSAVVRYHDDGPIVFEMPDDLDSVRLVIVAAASGGAYRKLIGCRIYRKPGPCRRIARSAEIVDSGRRTGDLSKVVGQRDLKLVVDRSPVVPRAPKDSNSRVLP